MRGERGQNLKDTTKRVRERNKLTLDKACEQETFENKIVDTSKTSAGKPSVFDQALVLEGTCLQVPNLVSDLAGWRVPGKIS